MKKLVLIIDDEADLVATLAQRLAGNGFRVAAAADGQDGLEKAGFLHPDAIILDINMPKLDGWGVCDRLRAQPAFRATPILILTAWLTDDLKRKADAAGASGIMIKPYDGRELVDRMRALCESPARGDLGPS